MDTLWQDVRFGARMLRKNRGITLIALLTLALGIGANTAIFTIVDTVMLRPLPYPQPDRLVVIAEQGPRGGRAGVAYPNFDDWRRTATSFSDAAGFLSTTFSMTGVDRPLRLRGRYVNHRFFDVLGVKPLVGRTFTAGEDVFGAEPVAILSEGLWRRQFGADADIVGKTILLRGKRHTIVGVMPRQLIFFREDDVYAPLGILLEPNAAILGRGNHYNFFVLARLKAGVTAPQAQQEIKGIYAQLERLHPNTNSGQSAAVERMDSLLVEDVRTTLLVLLAAVGFVVLIACVNVANLLMARGADREREVAVRLALGAGRGRIVRQWLTESAVLTLAGGLVSLVVGQWVLHGLLALVPADQYIPRLADARMDGAIFGYTAALSLLTGLLFGLFPALQVFRANMTESLKQGSKGSTSGTARAGLRKTLLVAEVAVALILLVGAGLMIRTVYALLDADPGFRTENLLTMRFTLPPSMTLEQRLPVYRDVVERVNALPGVVSTGFTISLPIEGSVWSSVFIVADKPVPARAELPSSAFTPVSPSFFSTMGIRLLAGREFNDGDHEKAAEVVIVNQTLAQRLWPGENPVGKRLKQGWPEDREPWREVVGVVADVKTNGIARDTPMQTYMPMAQSGWQEMVLVVRAAGDPMSLAPATEKVLRSFHPDILAYDARSMDTVMGIAIGQQRLTMAVLGAFALLAVILAAVGIYGVISFGVAQRTREIGIRVALGASRADVFRLIVGQGLVLTVLGVAIGAGGGLALARLMTGLLYGVEAHDPLTFVAVALSLAAVALAACLVPARRAMRVSPMAALRYE